MISVNTHEAKTKLSALLKKIETGGEKVTICRNGRPVAVIIPVRSARDRLKYHPRASKVKIKYDPTEPLTDGEWPEDAR